MKKTKLFASAFLLAAISIFAFSQQAQAKLVTGTTSGGFKYTYTTIGTTATITGYSGKSKSATIPSTIGGKSVQEIYIANNTTLESLTIPSSVCYFTPTRDVNKGEEFHVFPGCTNLKSITVQASKSGNYKSINGILYNNLGTELLAVPQGLTGSVTVPKAVTTVKPEAFMGCKKVTSIQVATGNTKYASLNGVLVNKSKTTLVAYPIGNTNTAFTVPAGIKTIGKCAFAYAPNLVSLTTSSSVGFIEESSIAFSPSLTSVNFVAGLHSISSYALCYNTKLSEVKFPEGLGEISEYSFFGCSSLKNITIPSTVYQVGDQAFPYKTLATLTSKGTAILFEGTVTLNPLLNLTAHSSNTLYKLFKAKKIKGSLTGLVNPSFVSLANTAVVTTKSTVKKGTGKSNTKWYNKKKKTFYITTPDQLAGIETLLKKGISFNKKTIVLKNNIDLIKYKNWNPIGFNEKEFKGTFDGKGYTVTNLRSDRPMDDLVGLFQSVGDTATIKNLTVKAGYVRARAYAGLIAGSSEGYISKCKVYGNVSAGTRVGGITGFTEEMDRAKVKDCTNYATVHGVSYVGGLVGLCNCSSSDSMQRSKNSGKATGYFFVGSRTGFLNTGFGS